MRHIRARAEHLLRTEGLPGLLGGVRRRLRAARRAVFTCEVYVVYLFATDVSSLPLRCPDVAGLDVAVFESLEAVHRLVKRGYDVPLFHPAVQTRWLNRGGVAFCAFVDRRLAHVAWVALHEDARGCPSMDGTPRCGSRLGVGSGKPSDASHGSRIGRRAVTEEYEVE